METETLQAIRNKNNIVLACGGGTPIITANQAILKQLGVIVFLDTDRDIVFKRIMTNGVPAFFANRDKPSESINELLKLRIPVYSKLADIHLEILNESPEKIVAQIKERMRI